MEKLALKSSWTLLEGNDINIDDDILLLSLFPGS